MKTEETVLRWKAEEDAVRARLAAAPGVAQQEQLNGRTGMEVFEAIFAGELPRPPIGDAVPLVRAEGRLVHAGRQVATAEGRLVGPDGKLYAHASTTCLIFDQPSPAHRASLHRADAASSSSEIAHVSA